MKAPPHGRNTVVLSLVEAFWGIGLSVLNMGTVLPVFLLAEGAPNGVIALLPALSALGAGLTQGLSGWMVRHSTSVKAWVVALHILSPTPLALVGIWLLLGRGGTVAVVLVAWGAFYGFLGVLFPLWLDYMARILDPGKRGRAFGTIFFLQTLAGAGGSALASGILERSTSHATYALLFFIAWATLAGGSLFFLATRGEILPERRAPAPTLWAHLRTFFGFWREAPWLRNYMVVRWLVRGTYPLVVHFFAARAVIERGATASQAAAMGVAALVCQALAGLLGGILGDRYGHRVPVLLGAGSVTLAAGLMLLPLPLWGYFVVAGLSGAFLATEYSSQSNWVMELAGPSRRQEALALAGFLLTPASVALPLLGGWLMDVVGFRPVSGAVALCLLIAMAVAWRGVPNPKPGSHPA